MPPQGEADQGGFEVVREVAAYNYAATDADIRAWLARADEREGLPVQVWRRLGEGGS